MSKLFEPLVLRDVTFRNRAFVSPMCQYSSNEGLPADWHLVHLGSRAIGGFGMVMVEASAVSPEGRISPDDSGIWSARHAQAFKPITRFISEQGAVPGIQIAHAGRKASTAAPWLGGGPLGEASRGWQPMAPSAFAFDNGYPEPLAMTEAQLKSVKEAFVQSAQFSLDAGFQVLEIHMAHGYLLHEFLSPLSNHRSDGYGGGFEQRLRYPLDVARAVRAVWPENLPLFVRISATDWVDGGWSGEDSVQLARRLKTLGVDLIDCSTGGLVPHAKIPAGPGFQVPFSAKVRREAGVATGAVGFITEAEHAEAIVATGEGDVVFLAREALRDPYWALHAAHRLGAEMVWPKQYDRARIKHSWH
ncbi:MAG TPA: NADH:flavin oxidoreductase/NADH oxidase [Burkholderiales bacterium]|nr:NADH:flavin oxidoreductase/NADH oxidase [Burkholderiales bacterium]